MTTKKPRRTRPAAPAVQQSADRDMVAAADIILPAMRELRARSRNGAAPTVAAACALLDGLWLSLVRGDRARIEAWERTTPQKGAPTTRELVDGPRIESERWTFNRSPPRAGVDRAHATAELLRYLRQRTLDDLKSDRTPAYVANALVFDALPKLMPDLCPPSMALGTMRQIAADIAAKIHRHQRNHDAPPDDEKLFSMTLRSFDVPIGEIHKMTKFLDGNG